jgi:choline dehydrogenase
MTHDGSASALCEFDRRAVANQAALAANLTPAYDFIVCGAGSSESVTARRLAENPAVNVLVIEAGGIDDVPSVVHPAQWSANLGSERDWGFLAERNPHLCGRAIPMSMGKALGGGSSINVMVWARGHKSDWSFFASEADDAAWGHEAVLAFYRRIESWQGAADPAYRGTSGPAFVQPSPNPSPIAGASRACRMTAASVVRKRG